MANNDGFGSSEIMYPAVTTTAGTTTAGPANSMPTNSMPTNPMPTNPMVAAAPFATPAMPAMGGPAQQGPELIHGTFNQIWLMNCLRRRWVLALLMGAIFAAGVAAFLLLLFPLSSSVTALVEIKQETTNVMEVQNRFSQQKLEVFQETQLSLIKSQFVLNSALGRRDISQLEAVKKEEPDALIWLQDNLKVGFFGETLQVRYDGEENTEELKKIVNAVIKSYEQDVLLAENAISEEMKDSLKRLHQELSDELKGKIERYQSLAEELGGAESATATAVLNMLINEIRMIKTQIIGKKQELIDINVTRAVTEQHARSTTALEQAVSMALDEDPMLANYKAEEFSLLQQIRLLKSTSKTGATATIKRYESQLAQLQQESAQYRMETEAETRKALKNAPNDMLTSMMTEFILRRDSITLDIKTLEAEYDEKVAEVEAKGVSSGVLTMLESEIEQLQQVESDMEYKLRGWEIQDQASGKLFRVLQKATAIEKVNAIQRYTLAGLGGVAAFCATCYGVALIEFRRRRLNGASDMDEGLGLRVLGVLPSVGSRKAMAPGGSVAAQLSESIDNVRATLLHDSAANKRQVILITSPATMEGTTTVASHLALSLTRAGRRTLIVDGDIREPALHKLFGLGLDEGLCEVLRTDAEVSDVIRPTNTEGLWLLTAGHCDMDAVHALATDQLQPIFEKLREEFDFIIIDGAPILGLADSISIGQHVDGAILTVLRDHSEVRKVYQAIELLKSMGIRLLGSVVNGVPIKADRRIAQLHKSNAKPRKIAASATATTTATATKSQASKTSAKVEEPAVDLEDTGLEDIVADLNDDAEIDFDDFDIDGKS